jgi:hypothetical protein
VHSTPVSFIYLFLFFLKERPTVALASASNGELPKIPFDGLFILFSIHVDWVRLNEF